MGGMEFYDLWNQPINIFCNSIKAALVSTENLKRELKSNFPDIFSEVLEMCTKAKAKFELKDNLQLIFKPKRQIPFAAQEIIEKELDCLEKIEVLSKTNYSLCK